MRSDPRTTLLGWALALGALAYQVGRGHLAFIDAQVAHWVAAVRSPAIDEPIRMLTFFGSTAWTMIGLVALGVLALRRGGVPSMLILGGAFVAGGLMEIGVRLSVPHWRPDVLAVPASTDLMTRFELAGFPSGHGFRSGFVFGWLARELNSSRSVWAKLGRLVCFVMIGLVGLSRLYLNRHWASDVLGAWLVVLVSLSIARVWEQTSWTKSSRHSLKA